MDVFIVSLLLFGLSEAQWQFQTQATQTRVAPSGSEGPCGPYMQQGAGQRTRFVRQARQQVPNMADMLNVPAGMSVREAAALELDLHNPYDLDLPDAGSFQPGMNDRATGFATGFNPNLPQPNTLNRVPAAVNQGGRRPNRVQTVQSQIAPAPRFQPAFVPPTTNSYAPAPPMYNNPQFQPFNPFGPRWNCQCDSAADCNTASLIRGNPYRNQCIFGYVCCCRIG